MLKIVLCTVLAASALVIDAAQSEETVRRPLGRFYGMAMSEDTPIQRIGTLTGIETNTGKKGSKKRFLVLTIHNQDSEDHGGPEDKSALLSAKDVDAALKILEKAQLASKTFRGYSTKEFVYKGSSWFSIFVRVWAKSNVVPQITVGFQNGRSMLCGGGATAVIPVLKEGRNWMRK